MRQNLIQPAVLIAIGLGVAVYAAMDADAALFGIACLISTFAGFEFRQTVLFNSDVEKLGGSDADQCN